MHTGTDLLHRSEHLTCVGMARTHCAALPVNTQTGSSVSAVWPSDDVMNAGMADFQQYLAPKPHPIRHTIQYNTSDNLQQQKTSSPTQWKACT